MVLLHLLLQDVAKRNRYPDPIPVAYSMRRLLIIIAQVDILIFSYMFHNTQKGIKNRLTIFFTLLRVWLFKTGYNRRKKKSLEPHHVTSPGNRSMTRLGKRHTMARREKLKTHPSIIRQ